MVATRYHAGADTGTEGQRGSVPVCRPSLHRTQSWFLSLTDHEVHKTGECGSQRQGWGEESRGRLLLETQTKG